MVRQNYIALTVAGLLSRCAVANVLWVTDSIGGTGSCATICERELTSEWQCSQSAMDDITAETIVQTPYARGETCSEVKNFNYAGGNGIGQCTHDRCCNGMCVNACIVLGDSNPCEQEWQLAQNADANWPRVCACEPKQNKAPELATLKDGAMAVWVLDTVKEPGYEGDCDHICARELSAQWTCNEQAMNDLTFKDAKKMTLAKGAPCSEWGKFTYNQGIGQCKGAGCCGGSCEDACQYDAFESRMTCQSTWQLVANAHEVYNKICACQLTKQNCSQIGGGDNFCLDENKDSRVAGLAGEGCHERDPWFCQTECCST